jgi:hypothetical protein
MKRVSIFLWLLAALPARAATITMDAPSSSTWTSSTTVAFDVEIADAGACYGFVDWNNSLIGWWKGNGNANDSSAVGNNGTAVGTVTYDTGEFGQCFVFATSRDYVTIPENDAYDLHLNDSFTIAMWVKKAANGSSIVFRKIATLRYYGEGTDHWRWIVGDKAVNHVQHSPAGIWSHLCLTYDGSTHLASMYFNGTVDETGTVTTLGNYPNQSDMVLSGDGAHSIDEVLWFHRCFSANEVARLVNGKSAHLTPSLVGSEMTSYAYTVHATSSDGTDMTNAASSPILIDVPNTGPLVTLGAPGDNLRTPTTTQTFHATVAIGDTGTTLTQAQLYGNWPAGGSLIAIGDPVSLSGTSASPAFTVNSLPTGTWSWKVQATDNAKNSANSSTHTLRIGNNTFYVAPTTATPPGNDSNAGTIDAPFLTIQHFADNCYPGDICYLRAGTYRETVTPVRGGASDASITISGYTGETATISGADPIPSDHWSVDKGSIYKTDRMTWDLGRGKNQIFCNGTMMIEARWPNATNNNVMTPNPSVPPYKLLTPSGDNCSVAAGILTIQDGDLYADPYAPYVTFPTDWWVGATYHGTWSSNYHAQTALVTHSWSTVEGGNFGNLTATMDNNPGWAQATPSDFDLSFYYLTGCYNALDTATEWYYNSATSTLYFWSPGGDSPAGYTVEAKARPVAFNLNGLSYVTIQNLNIRAANITSDSSSSYLTINNINAKYLSHYSIIDTGDIGTGQKGITDTGIVLSGSHDLLENSTIDYSAGNGVSVNGNYCTVTGCTITNCNYMCSECACVTLGSAGDDGINTLHHTISHNTLAYSGRALITVTNAFYFDISYNDISYACYGHEVVDNGGIYAINTNGHYGSIAYNLIHDIRGDAIYLDRDCSNFNLHHNVTYHVNSTDGGGSNHRGIHLNGPVSTGHHVYNNTLVANEIALGTLSGGTGLEGTLSRNNICTGAGDFASYGGTASNNLDSSSYTSIYNNYAGGDYTLKAGSPAIDAGTPVGFTTDARGMPIHGAPDIGAFEYVSEPATFTLTIAAAHGSVARSPQKSAYSPGETVTLKATEDTGYSFANWAGDLSGSRNPTTLVMNSDKTVTANFVANAPVLFTLSVTAVGGTVLKNPDKTGYGSGETVILQAVPSTGRHFVGWSGDLTGTNNPATLTMDGSKSVTVNFAADTYSLTINSTHGAVTRNPDKVVYGYGEAVTLSAVAQTGYEFDSWTGALAGGSNPATLVMDSDKVVTASFRSINPDTKPPVVLDCRPEPNAIQVPLNSLVLLRVLDDGKGVDPNTVAISLGDTIVYTGNVPSYRSDLGVCRRIGTSASYTYAYQSDKRFDFDQTVKVTVHAADIGGNIMPAYSYAFTTEMRAFGRNLKASNGSDSLDKGKPATVRDSAGNIWAVWHAGAAGQRDIYVSKLVRGGGSFRDPVRLTTGASDECNPGLALGADSKLYVVWQDNRRGSWDVYIRTSIDGVTWSEERRVTDSKSNHVSPTIVVDGQLPGRAYVAWQDDGAGNQDIYVASSNDGFVTKMAAQVTSDVSDQIGPRMAVDSSNTVYLVWTDRRNGSDDIYGASSVAGSWKNVPLVTGSGNQNSPAVAAEATGSILYLAWVDDASGNQDVYYASSNGLPASPLVGMNLVDDTLGADQTAPAISTVGIAGNGLRVFVCWRDERNVTAKGGDADLYFVEVRSPAATNILIRDDGTGSDQSEPALGIDSFGYPYVVWTDSRNSAKDIYYCGSTYMGPDVLSSGLVIASAGGAVGTTPASSLDDASVVIPGGGCSQDVTITITPIQNPQPNSSACVIPYDFGPSGLEFSLPVTITIPYAVADFGSSPPVPCWYDSETGSVSQQGIAGIETLNISSSVRAVRFRTTHFTPYVLLPAPTDNQTVSGGSSIGGGGCSLTVQSEGDPVGYFVPYVILAIVMRVIRLGDVARRSASQ